MIDLEAIRERLREGRAYLEECEFPDPAEQVTVERLREADADIDALLAEIERLRDHPPYACPTCDWHFVTRVDLDQHLGSGGLCPGIAAAASLTGEKLL